MSSVTCGWCGKSIMDEPPYWRGVPVDQRGSRYCSLLHALAAAAHEFPATYEVAGRAARERAESERAARLGALETGPGLEKP